MSDLYAQFQMIQNQAFA